jgi:anti-sigma B factor antagonist
MKLSYEDHSTISVVTISGELTADQGDAFRRACQDRLHSGAAHIILELEYLTLIDSAGLELLLWLLEEIGKKRGQLRLVKPDDNVMKALHLTRLDRRFTLCESVEEAARSLR